MYDNSPKDNSKKSGNGNSNMSTGNIPGISSNYTSFKTNLGAVAQNGDITSNDLWSMSIPEYDSSFASHLWADEYSQIQPQTQENEYPSKEYIHENQNNPLEYANEPTPNVFKPLNLPMPPTMNIPNMSNLFTPNKSKPKRINTPKNPQKTDSNIEEQKQYLNNMISQLKGLNRIDNLCLLNAWKLHVKLDMANTSKFNQSAKISAIEKLYNYAVRKGKPTPTSNDILDFIIYGMSNRTRLWTPHKLLQGLRYFFAWTSNFDIYPNVTTRLKNQDIYKLYGESSRSARKRTNEFAEMMSTYSPDIQLKPSIVRGYIQSGKSLSDDELNIMEMFESYIDIMRITHPTIQQITEFMTTEKMRQVLVNHDAVIACLDLFKSFFRWTSRNRNEHGKILYPNIGHYLDKVEWIETLLFDKRLQK